MSKNDVNNYDYITYYFRDKMRKNGIIPNDSLKDFVLENTKDYFFLYHSPQTAEYLEHMMFQKKDSFEKYTLYYEPGNDSFVFWPEYTDRKLVNSIQAGEKVHNFHIQNTCTKEVLDENGYYEEAFDTINDKISASYYSYEDTLEAYEAMKSQGRLLNAGTPTYGYALLANRTFPTLRIQASMKSNNTMIIDITD